MFNQLYYDQFNKTYAEQVALGHLHLDGIKYIYYSQNRNYFDFYKNIIPLTRYISMKD